MLRDVSTCLFAILLLTAPLRHPAAAVPAELQALADNLLSAIKQRDEGTLESFVEYPADKYITSEDDELLYAHGDGPKRSAIEILGIGNIRQRIVVDHDRRYAVIYYIPAKYLRESYGLGFVEKYWMEKFFACRFARTASGWKMPSSFLCYSSPGDTPPPLRYSAPPFFDPSPDLKEAATEFLAAIRSRNIDGILAFVNPDQDVDIDYRANVQGLLYDGSPQLTAGGGYPVARILGTDEADIRFVKVDSDAVEVYYIPKRFLAATHDERFFVDYWMQRYFTCYLTQTAGGWKMPTGEFCENGDED